MLQLNVIHASVCAGGLVLWLIMADVAMAQRRDQGGTRPGSVSPARLLSVDAVQAELRLTSEQKAKVVAINETLTIGRQELFANVPKDTGKRAPKLAVLAREAQDSIDKLLDDAQENRLKELLLQVNGASELTKPEIREALGITKEQRKKIAEVRQANAKARRDARTGTDGEYISPAELQREGDAKLLAVLTEEQRKEFEAMQGEKVTIDLFSF